MTPKVIYRDAEGNRRTKAVRCSILASASEVIGEFLKQSCLPDSTYVYLVKEGGATYAWHDRARKEAESRDISPM